MWNNQDILLLAVLVIGGEMCKTHIYNTAGAPHSIVDFHAISGGHPFDLAKPISHHKPVGGTGITANSIPEVIKTISLIRRTCKSHPIYEAKLCHVRPANKYAHLISCYTFPFPFHTPNPSTRRAWRGWQLMSGGNIRTTAATTTTATATTTTTTANTWGTATTSWSDTGIIDPEAIAVIKHRSAYAVEGTGPIADGAHPLDVNGALDLNGAFFLVDLSTDLFIKDKKAEDLLDLWDRDFELARNKVESKAREWRNEFDECLCADIPSDFVDVLSDERVREDICFVCLQNRLVAVDLVVLVCFHQVCHRGYAGIAFVWLRFLRFKRVDFRFHQHACKNEVLEHLNSLQRTRFIVVAEGFEKIALGLFPVPCAASLVMSPTDDR